MFPPEELRLETLLQHLGEEDKPHGAVVPPLYQNSLFVFPDYDTFAAAQTNTPAGPPFHYSRLGNPTLDVVEKKLAMLEGTEAAKVFGGGMAAISVAIISHLEAGAHMIVVDTCYTPVRQMCNEFLPRFGVSVTYVDGRTPERVFEAVRPETKLIYLETPSSFVFRVQDLQAIASFARKRGIATICDNTYATPLFQNPAKLGIHMVVHSATKYLSGHSDITAGVLCTSRKIMDRLIRQEVNLFSSLLSPFGAWLLLRGLRTLPLRIKAHQEAGNRMAGFLREQPEVEQVYHVGLADHPQRELIERQMCGSAGLLSFQPRNQDPEYIKRFVNSLELFGIGVSWGGFESLVVPLQVCPIDWQEPKYLVRFSIGLENVEDLMADVRQAFRRAKG